MDGTARSGAPPPAAPPYVHPRPGRRGLAGRVCPVSDDDVPYRLTEPAGDEPARVLRRVFLIAVVLLFAVGLPLGTGSRVFGIVLALVALAVELLLPKERRLAEWQVLVAGRAGLTESAYAATYQALREHEVPAEVQPLRVRYEGAVRNGLSVRRGRYRAEVSVQGFGADLVLGSRYVPGGGTVNWGAVRKLVSRAGSLYARTILHLPQRDLTGGFKCFRRRVLESIDLASVHSTGYAFQIELTYRAIKKGFLVEEIPIVFEDRRVGHSKLSRGIILEALAVVWKLRLKV